TGSRSRTSNAVAPSCCRVSGWRASTASPRWSTSPRSRTGIGSGERRAACSPSRSRGSRRWRIPGTGRHEWEAAKVIRSSEIVEVYGRRVWDSRGRPTIEAEVSLDDGSVGRGIAPAGASRGSHEAVDKRDGGERLGGHDVTAALAGIAREIGPALLGMDAAEQALVDDRLVRLDGTPNKERLGGNAIVAVSL